MALSRAGTRARVRTREQWLPLTEDLVTRLGYHVMLLFLLIFVV